MTKQDSMNSSEAAPQEDGAPGSSLSYASSLHPSVVTRGMREVGAEILMTYRGVLDSECLAAAVYSAMAGFERAVKVVAKSPPQHRVAKKKQAAKSKPKTAKKKI